MELSQGNTLYSYLKQIKMSFSFTKLESRRTEQVLSESADTSGREEDVGKGYRSMNIV
jgi:hypothetical protein